MILTRMSQRERIPSEATFNIAQSFFAGTRRRRRKKINLFCHTEPTVLLRNPRFICGICVPSFVLISVSS